MTPIWIPLVLLIGAIRLVLILTTNIYYALVYLPVTAIYSALATLGKKLE